MVKVPFVPPQTADRPFGCPGDRLPVDTVAALYVATGGCYFGLDGVDPWDKERDARMYAGPWPVIAHPPCERWGRFWHGSTRKPHQYELGADDGCFKAALAAVRQFGGVLEHPCDSQAWRVFGLTLPPREGGWIMADGVGGWTCCVYQGRYGHMAGKPTWLYACDVELPELRWGKCEQRLHPVALAKHGYAKARRIGMMSMIGGKNKKQIRDATPPEFRDVLIAIARTCVVLRLWRTPSEAYQHGFHDGLHGGHDMLGGFHALYEQGLISGMVERRARAGVDALKATTGARVAQFPSKRAIGPS